MLRIFHYWILLMFISFISSCRSYVTNSPINLESIKRVRKSKILALSPPNVFSILNHWVGERAPGSWVLPVLAEDPSLVPSISTWWFTAIPNSSYQGPDIAFWPPLTYMWCAYTPAGKTLPHKTNKFKNYMRSWTTHIVLNFFVCNS